MKRTKRPTRGSGKGAVNAKKGKDKIHNSTPLPLSEETSRKLAALPPVEYDQLRKDESKRLGIRVSVLDDLVAQQRNQDKPAPAVESKDSGKKQSTLLLELADDVELFHDGADAYADIDFGDHRETMALRSQFRQWFKREYWVAFGTAPSESAMQEALGVLEGIALWEGVERKVHVRVAEHDGKVYLDLADEGWRVVEISPSGWKVVTRPAVKFVRRNGMLPLPAPETGGDLQALRPFVNVESDEKFILLASTLLGALHPRGPYTPLILGGEQGSAKSTVARLLRLLIDPNMVPLRSPPRNEKDLIVAARNSWLICFDNISTLPQWLSDAICRLATGGGLGDRLLFTNLEESLCSVKRPIILNGIGSMATSSDLIDRSIILELEPLSDFRDELEFFEAFEAIRPQLLGSLMDAVSAALRGLPDAQPKDHSLRMMDFSKWIIAAEPALPWTAGSFETAYRRNRGDAVDVVLDDLVADGVRSLLEADPYAELTPTELLLKLADVSDDRVTRSKDWPKTPASLSTQLRRLAPAFRCIGIKISLDDPKTGKRLRTTSGQRLIRLEKAGKTE
ncbi:MAG: hypothetical protein V3S34_00730 [Hyphomicrobium sp.]